MIKEIRELVKRQAEKEDWDYHINLVVKYSLLLAKKYKVDRKQVELVALLHDIGGNQYKLEQTKVIFPDRLAENQRFPVRKI